MPVELQSPVKYFLDYGESKICINNFIGKNIRLTFSNEIRCIACDKKTNKSFGQGFCYPCFLNSPRNSECIVRPELCMAHEHQGRDPQWEEENHNVSHCVYLAQTNDVKVGVTRSSNTHSRWIDQGARKTIKLAVVPYRQLAGLIEIELKQYISDKTNWTRMLKDERGEEVDLVELKKSLIDKLPDNLKAYADKDNTITEIVYPVENYPDKVKSVGFDKETMVEGKLVGIRGQYLMFTNGNVINLRKHTGYMISFEVLDEKFAEEVIQGVLF
ncbi:MAG: DUF2797 domain-containing protein [Bacteroidetes bacterium]|nr:DUF2797 domain-containing protein [Bacteroidota bacterium]